MNVGIIMGRTTGVPELKTTANGISVTAFTVAVDRDYTPKGGEKQTDFIPCVAWRQTAEFVHKYFGKGDLIAIEGQYQSRTYEDRQGNKRTVLELIVRQAHFCGYRHTAVENSRSAETPEESYDEDLPF